MKNTLFIAILLFTFVGVYAQKTLTPVDAGSKIHFVIKNFGINTGGDISGMLGAIKFNPAKPETSSISVTAAVKSIDTDNEKRDTHLQQDEFFNAEKYPVISLESSKIESTNTQGTYMFTGTITIKGTSKPVHFPFTAVVKDDGYLFSGEFEINRRDYQVGGDSATMSDSVSISFSALSK
ncbi:MAG: YceI family protein [Ferruginibacter sp.]